MTTLYCSNCGEPFEPDDDHAWAQVEFKRMDDANELDEFAFCKECWLDFREEWGVPA